MGKPLNINQRELHTNKIFQIYIRYLSGHYAEFRYDKEVSICSIIKATLVSIFTDISILFVLTCCIALFISPLIGLITHFLGYSINNDAWVAIASALVVWAMILINTIIQIKNKIQNNKSKSKQPNKFILLFNDMWYSIKTKTCFKVKIRD
jgi:hypothetical protein